MDKIAKNNNYPVAGLNRQLSHDRISMQYQIHLLTLRSSEDPNEPKTQNMLQLRVGKYGNGGCKHHTIWQRQRVGEM